MAKFNAPAIYDSGSRCGTCGLCAARLPAAGHDDDWADGTSPAFLRDIIGYWREHFDWRIQEAALNKFTHFRATVDGTSLHFIHERGRGQAPLPILLLHGYPDI